MLFFKQNKNHRSLHIPVNMSGISREVPLDRIIDDGMVEKYRSQSSIQISSRVLIGGQWGNISISDEPFWTAGLDPYWICYGDIHVYSSAQNCGRELYLIEALTDAKFWLVHSSSRIDWGDHNYYIPLPVIFRCYIDQLVKWVCILLGHTVSEQPCTTVHHLFASS